MGADGEENSEIARTEGEISREINSCCAFSSSFATSDFTVCFPMRSFAADLHAWLTDQDDCLVSEDELIKSRRIVESSTTCCTNSL